MYSPNPRRAPPIEQLARVARAAEEIGFSGFFRSDHYQSIERAGGLPGPTDAWVTLAGLALETRRIRLGTLMTCATFRLPGPLAIAVAQVDQMSQGRVDLGIGAGWYATEHAAYGIPFPDPTERFERLTEQLEIISGLWGAPDGHRLLIQGSPLPAGGFPRLAQALAAPRSTDSDRRNGQAANSCPGSPICRRVQRRLRLAGCRRRPV